MLSEYELYARIVEAGGLSAAARDSGLSPGQVSKRLARLESRLGVRLLDRTTRQQSLTEPGRQFYGRVRDILDSAAEAEAMVSGRGYAGRGLVRISAPTSFGRMHLVPHIPALLERQPGLALEVNLSDTFVDLEAEGVDLALRIAALDDASAVRLAPNRRLLCATPEYLARHGEPRSLAELKNHRLLAATPQSAWRLTGPDGPVSHRVRSVVQTNSSEVVRELVLGHVGIALRSTWDVSVELADGRLQPVLAEYRGAAEVGIHAIVAARRQNAPSVRALVDFLRDLYGPHPYWDRRVA